MKAPKFIVALAVLTACSHQIAVADIFSFTNNLAVPDGQASGASDVESVSSSVSQIGSVEIGLNISGNFNGDLYAYVEHDNVLSVLLNRPGRTAGNSFGYPDSGFNILLSDSAANGNIHTYETMVTLAANSPLTGAWQPDGRTNNPTTVLDTDPSTAPLSVFDGLNASGNWTLFVADLSPGGTSELVSWQLIVNPVPEPSVGSLGLLGLGAGLVLVHRQRKHNAKRTEPG